VKNMEDRLIVLNRIAAISHRGGSRDASGVRFCAPATGWRDCSADEDVRHGVEEREGARGERVGAGTRKSGTGGFRRVRVHDLKHTFGPKAPGRGVSFEIDRICWDIRAVG